MRKGAAVSCLVAFLLGCLVAGGVSNFFFVRSRARDADEYGKRQSALEGINSDLERRLAARQGVLEEMQGELDGLKRENTQLRDESDRLARRLEERQKILGDAAEALGRTGDGIQRLREIFVTIKKMEQATDR